jgi:hypothetical protein
MILAGIAGSKKWNVPPNGVGPKNSCGDPFVFMVEAAEHRPSADVEAFSRSRAKA